MNIFLTSACPFECALALDDVRLNKMILETAQLLSGAYRKFDESNYTQEELQASSALKYEVLYKATHINHPCAKWTRAKLINYTWLLYHFKALYNEKLYRTDKPHLSYTKLWDILTDYSIQTNEALFLQEQDFTFDCSNVILYNSTVFDRYKECLRRKWKNDHAVNRKPTWIRRGPPSWLVTVN